ncbi:MAG: TonB-dependent receptor [Acidobacteria bacterium]|nr:TonB-dependent receptor [Acidobacteriota bacterium]
MNRSRVRLLMLAVLACGAASALRGQGTATIQGQVVSEETGTPLPGASILLKSPLLSESVEILTDEEGRFSLQRLSPGEYLLVARSENFADQELDVVLRPRETRVLSLALHLRPLAEEVVVTAERSPILNERETTTSTLLEDPAIRMFSPAQRTNLMDLMLATVPGTVRGHDDLVHLRGSEIALNTFINGVSFLDNPQPIFSAGFSSDIIESVNVLTGGFPAEYGNRFGGILDLVTKSGLNRKPGGSVTLGFGSARRNNLAVEYGGHAGNVGYYLYSAGFESNRFLSPPETEALHDRGGGMRNFVQLDFSLQDRDFLKLVILANGNHFEIPNTGMDTELRPGRDASQRTREQTAILTWDHLFSSDSMLSTSLYQRWSSSRLRPTQAPFSAIAFSDRSNVTVGAKSDYSRTRGGHAFKAGLDLVALRPREDLFYDPRPHIRYLHYLGVPHARMSHISPISFLERKTGTQASGYVQDKMTLGRQLTLDAGIRYDRYDLVLSTYHFSPRVNLAYHLSPTGTLFQASYNRFFVPPPLENVLVGSAGLTRYIREIGLNLGPVRPAVEDQFEAGFRQRVKNKALLKVTGFFRKGSNAVHTAPFPDARIFPYVNFAREKAFGLEVSADFPEVKKLGLQGYVHYTASRVYFFGPVTGGFISEPGHLSSPERFLAPMDQTHTASAGWTYRNRRRGFWTSVWLEFGSGTPIEEGGHSEAEAGQHMEEEARRVPSHLTANLAAGIDLFSRERHLISLQFNVENLTDNVYLIARESVFTPGQYFTPRLYSGSIRVHF